MQQLNNLIKSLNLQISPFESFKQCEKHHLEMNNTCLQSQCPHYFKSFCSECVSHKHKNMNIRYLNTSISKGMIDQWGKVQQEYQIMKQIQRNADVNLQYCIDIFKKMKEDVHKQINYGIWEQMIKKTIQLKKQVKNQSDFLRKIKEFSQKFHIEWNQEGKATSDQQGKPLIEQILKNRSKLQNINKFAQKALLFSQDISLQIQKAINKSVKNIKKSIKSVKLTSLSQLKQLKQQSTADELFLNLKSTSQNETQKLQSLISKFSNIKTLQIKTNKFNLKQSSWRSIIQSFPSMKFLRQLKLHLSGDLKQLPDIFETNKTILRPIDKLHIKVSDEKVKVEQIYRICNSFQLSGLWVTLSRCNLNYNSIIQLIQKTKIKTSMTNLLLTDLHFILTVNNLTQKQKIEINHLFQDIAQNITRHSIQL